MYTADNYRNIKVIQSLQKVITMNITLICRLQERELVLTTNCNQFVAPTETTLQT